jgi:RNA polymerase sigma-70 factor (ECF subfamily)
VAAVTLEEYRDQYERRIRGVVMRRYSLIGDDLDDVMSIILEKVWRALESGWVRDHSEPMAWLTSLACNAAIDWHRRRSHSRQPRVVATIDAFHHLADPAPEPERVIETEETNTAVWRAVMALPDSQRRAVTLAFWHEQPHTAIAEQLGIPLGTVKTRVYGGHKRLRVALVEAV